MIFRSRPWAIAPGPPHVWLGAHILFFKQECGNCKQDVAMHIVHAIVMRELRKVAVLHDGMKVVVQCDRPELGMEVREIVLSRNLPQSDHASRHQVLGMPES